MALTINHNTLAATAARNLSASYSRLSVSTQRLSSGLKLNKTTDPNATGKQRLIGKEGPAFIVDLSKQG